VATIRTPGRNITIGEACLKLNPHLNPGNAIGAPNREIFQKEKMVRQSEKPLMNGLESEFYERLKLQYPDSFICCQAFRLRIGNFAWYKPDFIVFSPLTGQIKAMETKGFSRPASIVRLKAVATQYPWISWSLHWKKLGTWMEQAILP